MTTPTKTLGRWARKLRSRYARRGRRDRQSGVALMMTISSMALLVALVSEFTYGTYVQSAQAANAKDELRAHYIARSAVSLSRLLIKIQQRFVEPIMAQAQKMLAQSSGGGDLGISLRVTDYAGTLMGFFGGSKDEASALGGLIGLNLAEAKGLGMNGGHMDAEITAEDGKIDINCAGGPTPAAPKQQMVYRMLTALTGSPRYNKLFEVPGPSGQYVDRTEIARAIIDWSDQDEHGFTIETGGSATEDYHYDARKDRYRAHNNFFDSVEEVGMVRGMDARFMEAFAPYLTVYPRAGGQNQCKVNLTTIKGDCTPLLVGLVRAAAIKDPTKPPADVTILDDQKVYPLASILCERGTAVGFDSLKTIVAVLSNPSTSIARDDPRHQMMQSMRGIQITESDLSTVAYIGPPRVYRIVATGESGKVKKKITAIVDMSRAIENPVTMNPQAERASGVVQYWREE